MSFPELLTEKILSGTYDFGRAEKNNKDTIYRANMNGCEIWVSHRPTADYPHRVYCKTAAEKKSYVGKFAEQAYKYLKTPKSTK